ncbi:serine/threonine protein kinase, partial [Streptomyces sp. A7024]
VKVVHPHFAADEQFRARFRREVEAARRVGGAWTAPVLDAGPDDEVPWVATGYVAGPALSQVVAEYGALPAASVRALGAGLAEALEAVHGLGLVHRDVKPSNVLLTLDGPRLIDFGIARATDGTASLTATGVSVGSPGYMAPEQILGRGAAAASDVFSLGAVLVFAATGRAPFPGESAHALLYQVVNEDPYLYDLDETDGELRELAERCLAKDADDRPQPRELARRLAPDGNAAGLVREGWLPQPLVEQISRAAVQLLDLEAAQEAVSGLVEVPEAEHPEEPVVPPPGFGPQAPTPAQPKDATATGREVRAAWRSRRLGCSVVLSVAATLAIAMLGLYLGGVLPGDGGGGADHAGKQPPATSAPGDSTATGGGGTTGGDTGGGSADPSPSATTRPDDGGRGEVPQTFAGIWRGDIQQRDGTPNGQVTVEVQEGAEGEYVAELTYDNYGMKCYSRGKLDEAAARELSLTETTDPAKQSDPVCTGAEATVTLTAKGGDVLEYRSDDKGGGNPRATLQRAD